MSQDRLAIEAIDLCKSFGDFKAVDKISLKVKEGQSFGLLGPNGAGKSTLIRMLTTLLLPSSGVALVAGLDVQKQADSVRKSIGVIPQNLTSDPELTAEENLNFYARLYGLGRSKRRRVVDEFLDYVDLGDWRDKLVGTFSGGMRRRLEIGRSLLHRPKVLFLDEPTTGLDPASRISMWKMIERLKEQSGLTLMLTTHYMEEADQLCDHGRIIALDSPAHLKSELGQESWVEIDCSPCPEVWQNELSGLAGVIGVRCEQGICRVRGPDTVEILRAILRLSQKSGIEIKSVAVREATLEDVFVHYTGRELRDSSKSSFKREISHLYN